MNDVSGCRVFRIVGTVLHGISVPIVKCVRERTTRKEPTIGTSMLVISRKGYASHEGKDSNDGHRDACCDHV